MFAGFEAACAQGLPEGRAGVWVEATFAPELARRAREAGALLAVSVDASGEEGAVAVAGFAPDLTAVRVRLDPDAGEGATAPLRELLATPDAGRRPLLVEPRVAAPGAPLASGVADAGRIENAIASLQASGIEPDLWAVGGFDEAEDFRRVAARARADGRDAAGCLVLARSADEAALGAWLRAAARTEGYRGFAIGRPLWWDGLVAWRDDALDAEAAAARIAERTLRAIEIWRDA